MFAHTSDHELTDRQREVLDVVRRYAGEHGYPPTVREIGKLLGLTSSSTVHAHLAALERAGFVQRDPTKPRALKWAVDTAGSALAPVNGGDVQVEAALSLPLIGEVAAGAPLLAEQNIEQYMPVPKLLAGEGESFLLKIRGDSMIDAGILDGDYVVVRSQQTARSGEIVIALLDDEATCKRLIRRDGRIVLQPANAGMQPIVLPDVEILGVVTGLMRAL